MQVIGIDPGLINTGWAVIEEDGPKIKFMGRAHNGSENCYFLTYSASNPKEGVIQIAEVIAE